VEIHGADLNDCFFTKAKIIKCNFWKSNFRDSQFHDSTISHIGLNETTIHETVFFKSPLFGCRIRLAHLDACIFEESDIVACTLAGTNLSRTVLYESAFIHNRLSEGGDYFAVLP